MAIAMGPCINCGQIAPVNTLYSLCPKCEMDILKYAEAQYGSTFETNKGFAETCPNCGKSKSFAPNGKKHMIPNKNKVAKVCRKCRHKKNKWFFQVSEDDVV